MRRAPPPLTRMRLRSSIDTDGVPGVKRKCCRIGGQIAGYFAPGRLAAQVESARGDAEDIAPVILSVTKHQLGCAVDQLEVNRGSVIGPILPELEPGPSMTTTIEHEIPAIITDIPTTIQIPGDSTIIETVVEQSSGYWRSLGNGRMVQLNRQRRGDVDGAPLRASQKEQVNQEYQRTEIKRFFLEIIVTSLDILYIWHPTTYHQDNSLVATNWLQNRGVEYGFSLCLPIKQH